MHSRSPGKKLLESQADWKFYYLYLKFIIALTGLVGPLLVHRYSFRGVRVPSPRQPLLAPSRRRPNLSFLNFLLISYCSRNRDRIKRNVHGRWTVTEMHRYTNGMPSLIFRSSPSSPVSSFLSSFSCAATARILLVPFFQRAVSADPLTSFWPIDAIGHTDERNTFFRKMPHWWRSTHPLFHFS